MSELISLQQEHYFSPDVLYNHVKKFNFPRISGTKGEKDAVSLTNQVFKQIGFNSNKIANQQFKFSDFYSKNLIKFFIGLNLITVLVILFMSIIDLLYVIIYFTIFAIALIFLLKALKKPVNPEFWGKYFGNEKSSTNVYVKIPASQIPENKAGNIIVSAHLDTKSQTYRTFWRIIAFILWLFGTIVLTILLLVQFLYDINILKDQWIILTTEIFNITIICIPVLIFTVLIISSNFLLLLLHTGNVSPGALDNASGMAIVFELSRYFRNNPLNNFNIWCVQFSAEELGTMGARAFLKKHGLDFKRNMFFQLNFDMVSCLPSTNNRLEFIQSYGIQTRSKLTKFVTNILTEVGKEEFITLKPIKFVIGAHTDSIPFRSKNFDAIDIVTFAATKYVHIKDDTPDKVDPYILREACRLTQRTLFLLDNFFLDLQFKTKI